MKYEKTKKVLLSICVTSGAALIILNTFILCTIVPVIVYHLLSEEAAVAWSPIVHIFWIFTFIFVLALGFLFGVVLVQYLNDIKRRELETEQGGGAN